MGLVRETYIARKRFTVGDRVVEPGDPVPEAENWRRAESWVNSGHLAVTFREVTDEPVRARSKDVGPNPPNDETESAETAEPQGDGGLGDLNVADLRKLAKERGLRGFSKLRKDELLELLAE